MFDCIYIENSLREKDFSSSETILTWMEEFLKQSFGRKIEYVGSGEIESDKGADDVGKTKIVDKGTLLIGETKAFLDKGTCFHVPVLAVLTNETEDLFSFPYAVCSLSDITLDYLELIQCRFEKKPYRILETNRLIVAEMDEESAIEYFRLKQTEPEYFIDQSELEHSGLKKIDLTAAVEESLAKELQSLACAYLEQVYPFYHYGIWAVYENDTNDRVGFAGVEKLFERDSLNLSYYIKESYRCRGYATEACQAIIAYIRQEFQEDTICCRIAKENKPSLSVARKLDVELVIV